MQGENWRTFLLLIQSEFGPIELVDIRIINGKPQRPSTASEEPTKKKEEELSLFLLRNFGSKIVVFYFSLTQSF